MRDNRSRSCILLIASLFLAVSCGGGGGGSSSGTSFWAADFTTNTPRIYKITATKVAEGVHCHIYLEQGQTLSQDTINTIMDQFDSHIYPGDTGTFGSEPNPGVDNDSKVYILLLDIKDGFSWPSQPSYIAGYFDPANEYSTSTYAYANQKEMVYMDINPAVPGSTKFFMTLAHEFQHMIHWEQERVNKGGAEDATWLNEGMSEIAPSYCGYGPSYNRVQVFENAPSDSLTIWNGSVNDYGVVYMWAQYFKDRFSGNNPNIFWSMLHNSATGINSVNQALSSSSLTFAGTFKDWAIANYSGNSITWAGHPEWSYISINTWPGTNTGGTVSLPGLFPSTRQNKSSLAWLNEWSVDYYSYTPVSGSTGTVTWTTINSSHSAALADPSPAIHPDLVSNQAYTYSTKAYLALANATGTQTGDTVTFSSVEQPAPGISGSLNSDANQSAIISPKAMLDAANQNPVQKELVLQTGHPEPVCIHPYFIEKEKSLKAQGARPGF